ncbi:hypothetical protein [Actinomycetospora termitidis]|uniref:Secreted protein n=1 Tax=Actinomycetospora termitidis TaxID=3053470 RepID=A0ABT7MHL7_9PSEU|nr:hypothetical protein [Actinomycetospora sp. Odt1-22]MDL5160145.1 hypothetical protein [Actinomycetospora sp. Odt1-22]
MVRAAVLALLILLVGSPAAAEPPEICGPHTAEDRVVRVFPRGEETSELLCGNRYYGFRRIDWSVVSLDTIARTLAAPGSSTYDARSETWTLTGEGAVVVITARHGQVITARAA